MKKIIFISLLALVPFKAQALELLLEENRGESGTIGYVDIDRVFKEYSGTTGAREEFISEIKKKEDDLNLKKTAVFTLKAEIAKLRQEREFALTLPSLLETQRSVVEAAAATAAAAAAAATAAAVQALTQTIQVSTQAPAVQASTQTPAVQGSTQAPAVQASTQAPAVQASTQAPAVQASTQTPTLPPQVQPHAAPATAAAVSISAPTALPPGVAALPGMDGIDMPGIAKVPVSHFKFSVSTSVPEIEAVLLKKEAELKTDEEELRVSQKQAERDLLDYESRKSEILLGRIYVALKELAVKEEVSVIVDKRNILFGQNAVDLTGKLLKKLEENGI